MRPSRINVLAGSAFVAAVLACPEVGTAQEFAFRHLAGTDGGAGWFDGPASSARFHAPRYVAQDGAGNVYVADVGNHTVRKVTPGGLVTTLAGLAGEWGTADGVGAAARFKGPAGIALDAAGNLYVADTSQSVTFGSRTIRKITPSGVVTTFAGVPDVGNTTCDDASQLLDVPIGIAVDSAGYVYVSDYARIRKVTPAGVLTTLAGDMCTPGSADGTGAAARFSQPTGLAVDGGGNVYVADTGNYTIRRITSGGVVTTLAGSPGLQGTVDGTGPAARFSRPTGVALDAAGNVYVADGNTIRKVTSGGVVTTIAGAGNVGGSADGPAAGAGFSLAEGIASDALGNLLVADTGNHTIRRITTGGLVSTVAGATHGPERSGMNDTTQGANGTGTDARFRAPTGVAWASGNLYVVDSNNSTIRKVTPAGVVTTLAGSPGVRGSADGTGSAAQFNLPNGIVADGAGNLYVTDSWNHTIRKVTTGGVVTTFAGTPHTSGSADGTGSAARFNGPGGIAIDGSGNLYVADSQNQTIRKITPGGVVSTLAGSAGSQGSVDGVGSAARFYQPYAPAVDADGNVYVSDSWNHSIRKVAPDGRVTTLAGGLGTQYSGYQDGTGALARFDYPGGITIGPQGDLYVSDGGNSAIRKVTRAGVVTTIAGGAAWGKVDGVGMDARFEWPGGLAFDEAGNLYLADSNNNSIRVGIPILSETPTIDQRVAPVGEQRSLGTSGSGATSWNWELVRIEPSSTAALSSRSVRTPTFTPDVPGRYVFRLTASNGSAANIGTVSLATSTGGSTATAVVDANVSACYNQYVPVEAVLTGTPPWTLVWSDGFVQSGIPASPAVHAVMAKFETKLLSVSRVSDAIGTGGAFGTATVTGMPFPATPTIVAPPTVTAGLAGYLARVATPHAGSTYQWEVYGATIVSGQGTSGIEFAAGDSGGISLQVVETDFYGCSSSRAFGSSFIVAPKPLSFSTLTPCRIFDTRNTTPLTAGETRVFTVGGTCGVPLSAASVSANVTVTQPAAAGSITVFPGDGAPPPTWSVSFGAWLTRASASVLRLSSDGQGTVAVRNDTGGTAHVILDVNGYFQ